MLRGLIPEWLKSGLKSQSKYLSYSAAVAGRVANADSIAQRLKRSYKPVSCPLIMVSQVERSGGSLMAQLFDGHPQLLAHPHELKFGFPNKRNWPRTDLQSPNEQFRVLFEHNNIDFCENGYVKGKLNEHRQNFFLVPYIQRELFCEAMKKVGRRTPRAVLDAYFTSYFNAWLNMRNRIEQAKFITGFVPMMAANRANMDAFWEAYPDGYLISIIRSPLSWHPSFVSLKGEGLGHPKVVVTSARWNESTEAMFRERERMKDRVIVLRFEDVVTKTEATMRLVCSRIGLEFHPSLVSPTFNWEPIASNSIFVATTPGVVASAPVERELLLSDEERRYLIAESMPLYERALREIVEKV